MPAASHFETSAGPFALGAVRAASPRFSLEHVPAPRRADIFREFFDRTALRFDIEPLGDVPLEADFAAQALPDVHLIAGKIQGVRNRRTRGLVADSPDDIALMVNLGGHYVVSQCGREVALGDGEATLVSCAEQGCLTHYPPGDFLSLRIPRARLAPLVIGLEDCFARHIPSAPALRLLTGYVRTSLDANTPADPVLQHVIATHVHDLAAVALGATRDAAEAAQGRGLRAARLHAIKQDIARHLDQPGLSLAVLAMRHRCTPRFIQRLFEVEGTTLTDYVLGQRLILARRMLADPRRAGHKIAAIAYDAGFADVSYFNRAFRRCFGASPSEFRAGAAARRSM